jgi:DMSO/TMAO reductase YedYZ molybdopterin-dependent catalytic subunit
LEFISNEQLGFWEQNGYHSRGEPWIEERYSR